MQCKCSLYFLVSSSILSRAPSFTYSSKHSGFLSVSALMLASEAPLRSFLMGTSTFLPLTVCWQNAKEVSLANRRRQKATTTNGNVRDGKDALGNVAGRATVAK